MYKIDIIIPTYNRAVYHKMAIDSVLNQTFEDYHIYVLDNCSNDNTTELIKSYSSDKLTYIRNRTNIGHYGNWNKALQTGSSEFFQIFHDDDILEPYFLDSVISLLSKFKDLVFVHTGAHIINDKNEIIRHHLKHYDATTSGNIFFENHLQKVNSIICPSAVFRREKILNKIKFDDNYPFTADVIFFLSCSRYGGVGYINKPLIKYRDHSSSGTSTIYAKLDLKIKDRFNHKIFLEREIKKRNINNSNDCANNYLKGALSADIWFMKVQGVSLINIFKVLPKFIRNAPSLIFYFPFWFSILKIFIPLRGIDFYKINLRK